MDVHIYQAALLCEDCGKAKRRELRKRGFAPRSPNNESTYDSDDYPKGPYLDGGGEADSPQHCDNQDECLNAESLKWRGRAVGKVGAFLENPLTSKGVEYLCEMVAKRGSSDYQKALHKLWLDYYRHEGYAKEVAKGVRENTRNR